MTTTEALAERLSHIGPLAAGNHEPDGLACVMEAVAFVAGEPWSAHPECACPVISTFLRSWNDALPDSERNALLRPLIPRLIGTRSTPALEIKRSFMAADWLVREYTPAWLRLAGLSEHANALASLPEITSMRQVPSLREPVAAARSAARSAAWDAAWAAAGDAAWAAAGDAAWDAARSAAWDAARSAAWAALMTTRKELQQSALALVERMIDAGGVK
jgi:hypothetical protein